jgi:hypothetical protein
MTRIDRRTLLTGAAALGASTFAPPPLAALAAPAQAFPAVSAEAAALWAAVAENHPWRWQNRDADAEAPEQFQPVCDATYQALWRIGALDAEEVYALSRWALASHDPWFRELGLAIIEGSRTLEGRRLDALLDIAEAFMGADQPYDVRLTALQAAAAHRHERPFPAADAMVRDTDPRMRYAALHYCWWWSDDRLAALAPLLRDADIRVRAQVIWTASHAFSDEDFDAMCALAGDADRRVRQAVALNLGRDTPRSLDALFVLTRDEDDCVRDYAFFTLGVLLDTDTPEVRAVLRAGLDDPEYNAAAEAALGLARRRDPSAIAFVADDLRDEGCARGTYEAAALMALPEFEADLLRHRDSGSGDDVNFRREDFDWAIARCRGEPVERGNHVWFVPSAADATTPPPDRRAA